MTERDLIDRVALVTGGASGIGRAAAELFVARGASVMIADVDEARAQATAAEIETAAADGVQVASVAVDVAVADQVQAMVAAAVERFGRLDIAVNNAGTPGTYKPFADQELADWQRTVDINLTGVFLVCKHGLRALLANGGGTVVCTASPTGQYGCAPGYDAYSSSKAGVYGLVRVMAADYAKSGIRINGVIPGYSDTAMTNWVDEQAHKDLLATIPLGRAGTAEEVAAVMLFLASDEASYVTGAVWAADGGLTAI
jgi:NAD(P)-dependent dehydrogenase (short-subunit alcohol dehydrogenase family)